MNTSTRLSGSAMWCSSYSEDTGPEVPTIIGGLDDPRDFVRIEIESALEREIPVIPILIDHTRMPSQADLPPSLAELTYRNAIEVDQGRDFHHHVSTDSCKESTITFNRRTLLVPSP